MVMPSRRTARRARALTAVLLAVFSWTALGVVPTAFAASPAGVVDRYALDEAAGSTVAVDSAGGENNGVCGVDRHACPTFGVAGVRGTAAGFDGIDDGIRIRRSISTDYSVSAWIKTTQALAGCDFAYCGTGMAWSDAPGNQNDTIPMALVPGGRIAFGTDCNAIYDNLKSTVAVNTGQWTHIAVTRDATTGQKRLYVNGALNASSSNGGTCAHTARDIISLGTNSGDQRYFAGAMDDIHLYTRTLGPAEVSSLATIDADGDGVADNADNCPNAANTGQTDSDRDGSGDACDSRPLRFEAEGFVGRTTSTSPGSSLSEQTDCCGIDWSGTGQLIFNPGATTGSFTVSFSVPQGGTYDVLGAITKSYNTGIFGLAVDGVPTGPVVDSYKNPYAVEVVDYGLVALSAGTHELKFTVSAKNPLSSGYIAAVDYIELVQSPDTDSDGVADRIDNCTSVSNAGQTDTDGDGRGDACDSTPNGDADGDGIDNNADNCPSDANTGQANLDGDTTGDACDPDIDGDGVANGQDFDPRDASESKDSDGDGTGDNADRFPFDASETKDSDNDGAGDNADPFDNDPTETKDTDGDGVGDNADQFPTDPTRSRDADRDQVADAEDNCVNDANTNQADLDRDGKGDACDDDIDGDGALNDADAFDRDPAEQLDSDNDGIGDKADRFPNDPAESSDDDDDGVGDGADNCKTVANPDQKNTDGDTQGDVCDADVEGDGKNNDVDNCPAVANTDQADLDLDGKGDACDEDRDGDGVPNGADWAPDNAAESKDSDRDGVGDSADAFPTNPAESKDTDQDHVGDNADNCVNAANEDQADLNSDGKGDACDGDIDGDGVANAQDAFPRDKSESKDSDRDGVGDNADRFPNDPKETTDQDDDGVGDGKDNCRTLANADQADLDRDGKGDACDPDIDGDGIANENDNAPRTPNADQQDLDGDGIGDAIDRTVLPRNADMCKKDGWKRFYDGASRFKNQGDCVSFVATGAKNLPAAS